VTSFRDGITLPVNDGLSEPSPVEAIWLSGPTVAVASVTSTEPYVSPPLAGGLYDIWTSSVCWINAAAAADSEGDPLPEPNTDGAATGEDAPKSHDGGHWIVAVRSGDRIAVRAKGSTGAPQVRIHRCA